MSIQTGGALTLERGLGILEQVANGVDRLDDLASATGQSRSSTHRMLTSFVNLRYLTLSPDNRYRLGVKLLELGVRAEATINLPDRVQDVLTDLSAQTSDASHLGILVDEDILYLAKARGTRGINMASRPGVRFRAQHTAMGKALLAELPDADALAYFDASDMRTERSIRTPEAFVQVLETVRERGYALDDQENELGITCVAVAIPDLTGKAQSAISVSAPSVYMTQERIEEIVAMIRVKAPEVTAYLPPDFATHWL